MRAIETRKINELNDNITITADERNPENGNASHEYVLDLDTGSSGARCTIMFQNGPIKEAGYNGFTNEALLEVVIDRLRCFQDSKFACPENQAALDAIEQGLEQLIARTQKRVAQGVEGTHELHS